MTFGVSRDAGSFEWSGTSGQSLFAQPENAYKPSFWRMIFDIVRFNQFALDLLSIPPGSPAAKAATETSIGEYLSKEGYSDVFRDDYLIPMTACVWSTGADKCALEFPALTLVRFMWNHHLLSTVSARPPWLTVQGGAKQYIDAVIKQCKNAKIHLSSPVEKISRTQGRVHLTLDGKDQVFDEVVLACHGDQARRLLQDDGTPLEKSILDAFETTPNTAYLHRDTSVRLYDEASGNNKMNENNSLLLIQCSADATTPRSLVGMELSDHFITQSSLFLLEPVSLTAKCFVDL